MCSLSKLKLFENLFNPSLVGSHYNNIWAYIEAYRAWSERSDNCIVPEQNIQPLFRDFKLFPTSEQVHDMLRTARLIVRGCNNCNKVSKHKNGLTFGEFSVLLSDIRKIRHTSILNSHDITQSTGYSTTDSSQNDKGISSGLDEHSIANNEATSGPEVFLGGSCNPTTWRADVAIPTLKQLGITFYNPQVSEWTPDLLELEHRAKEKAKVLFFVMDPQTRSAAGAIEVANIAGRNSKHLVLVLLPYVQQQKILNETLTLDEYKDLSRNQQLLKQLVRRRGLPVLDKISLALEHIKNILSGGPCRDQPHNIATRLISIRRTFDRVVDNSDKVMTLTQCQTALTALGYPSGIVSISVIKQILSYFDDLCRQQSTSEPQHSSLPRTTNGYTDDKISITFDNFCILESYLSVLQQEILETSCVSPIKGTNLQQPPIYLTDFQGWNRRVLPSPINIGKHFTLEASFSKNPGQLSYSNTGKDSPFNVHASSEGEKKKSSKTASELTSESLSSTTDKEIYNSSSQQNHTGEVCCVQRPHPVDSNEQNASESANTDDVSGNSVKNGLSIRDLYLGGSCWMLTNWRQNYAVPYLKSKNITFYTSTLHEGPESSVHFNETGEINIMRNDELIFDPAIIDASRILLFVITNQTRSLGAMTMAAHYMGLGYNIVLSVEMLPNDCRINGFQLSSSAIKDYNRGRTYLIDLAKRQNIPVYSSVEDALKSAVEKLNYTR
ncbi:uncharacterized protein LOC134211811 isoform X2 [Armigeres subalbatus]|uniref:uncharacterized protein LOC134211811 isoform X2 n=1 Tax=Armigeres subalbatus TaxID=124917 RepID=UPI002ED07704